MMISPVSTYNNYYPASYNAGYATTAIPTNPMQNSMLAPSNPAPAIYHMAYAMPWKNNLKQLFNDRKAIIYGLNLRSFSAMDKNNDGRIEPRLAENGTFLKAIQRLPYLKSLGVNTIHLLPINPVGLIARKGESGAPGSLYAPSTLEAVNGEFDEPTVPTTVVEEARQFVEAAHRLGIHVMADIPSCGAVDLERSRPELFARDEQGKPLTPTTWTDIRMFVKDSPALRETYAKLFKMLAEDIGVDGFRCDIARARSLSFWQYFISKYPNKAWLAESYVEEDASPMKNLPRDLPNDLLKVGFDSTYGQFHIFHSMNGREFMNYIVKHTNDMNTISPNKTFIGSFGTHDDPSLMTRGGAIFANLVSGVMMSIPSTNPYVIDGYMTGYEHEYNIFDWMKPVQGTHPEIGDFFRKMAQVRTLHEETLTKGNFTPLETPNPNIIAFTRQYGKKTLMVIANKNVNQSERANITVPGLTPNQVLKNIAPNYGEKSHFMVDDGQLYLQPIAPGRFYMFEVDLPPQKEALEAKQIKPAGQ